MLLLLANELMRTVFPSSITTVTGSIAKVHVDQIETEGLLLLAGLATKDKNLRITLRRSGTGITILLTFKE